MQSMKMQRKKEAGETDQQLEALAAFVEFSSQHPRGGSQPYVTLVTSELMSSSGFDRHETHT